MRFKATIDAIGPMQTGTTREGNTWTKRVITLSHPVVLDNGTQVQEKINADYFGEVPNEELLQLSADQVLLDVTVWFALREWTDQDTGVSKCIQNVTLKNMVRTL